MTIWVLLVPTFPKALYIYHFGVSPESYLLTETGPVPPKHSVPAQQPRKETIITTLLSGAGWAQVSQYEHRALVDERKCRKVTGMHARGF